MKKGDSNKEKDSKKDQQLKAQPNDKLLSKTTKIAKGTIDQLLSTRLGNPSNSVGTKLFFIIFVCIISCVLVVGLMAYSQTKSIVERKVSNASLQTINQSASNLDIIFKNYEDLTMQLLIDKDFHKTVQEIASSTDDYSSFAAIRELSDRIQNYVLGNSSILSVYLLPINDKVKYVTTGSASSATEEQMKGAEWFTKAQELRGKTLWIETQPEGFGGDRGMPTIGLARMMSDSTTNEASYVLLFEISVKALQEKYEDIELGKGSLLTIVDSNNNYIANTDNSLIGQPQNVTLPDNKNTAKLKTTDGTDVLAVYKTFDTMDWNLVGTIPVNELVKDAGAIRNMTYITAAVAIIIAFAIGYLIIRTIGMPLIRLRNLMNEGEQGNLTVSSGMKKRKDEIGQLAESFDRMMVQIRALAMQTTQSASDVLSTASELSDASRKTAISAKEISVATEEIANGSSSLAVEAERGSDLTSNINTQMQVVMQANGEMVQSALEVEKASAQGTTYMGVLIQKTGLTEEMTRSMVEKVDNLKDSTGSIVKILDVLNSLTKQTNILSLNATIEAARAGAAGKGFMVVADEIRKLADQSRQSIDVVAQITQKIQHEIEETVNVLSDAYPIFQEQIGSVKEANQIFLTVQGQMGQFIEQLDSVTGSISTLDQSQSVLSDAMSNVSAVAEESSATSEEVASLSSEQLSISNNLVSLSEKLDTVSRELQQSLSKFKID